MSQPPNSIIVKGATTKLFEYPIPNENISINIGKKSAQLLVTTSTDGYIRLWRLLNPKEPLLEINIIASINTYISTNQPSHNLIQQNVKVNSLCFDSKEELLLGGMENGILFIWDLNHAKLLRLFQGAHSGSVTFVDFSPYRDYFASGSTDCTVKTWCVTRKNCLQTYKGHSSPISTVRFTPDGHWLASGDSNGNIMLWDLEKGKILAHFSSHTDAVISIDFHPKEFFLATGSKDGSVKFWDLDTFKEVSTTPKNHSDPIQAISFTPDGKYLLSISKMHLRVWSWEPDRLHQEIRVDWDGIADFAIMHGLKNGFAVANKKNKIAAWCIVLDKLAPYSEQDLNKIELNSIPENEESNELILSESDSDTPLITNTTLETKKLLNHLGSSQDNLRSELRKAKRKQELELKKQNIKTEQRAQTPTSIHVDSFTKERKDNDEILISKSDNRHSVSSVDDFEKRAPNIKNKIHPVDEKGNVNYVLLSKEKNPKSSKKINISIPSTDSEFLTYLLDTTQSLRTVVSSRTASLKLISRLWNEDFKLEALDHLNSLEDAATTMEVVNHLTKSSNVNYITLHLCKDLLKLLINLLDSKIEPFILCSIQAADILDKKFYGQIKQTLHILQFSRESEQPEDASVHRSKKCRLLFLTFRDQLEKFRSRNDLIGQKSEYLHTQLSHYRRC